PQVLFICGNHNHTTMMHAIANELRDCDRYFTPYYCDPGTTLDLLRRLGMTEAVALGHEFPEKCLVYLASHALATDLPSPPRSYRLLVACADRLDPSNLGRTPLMGVQEGMIDPQLFWWKVMKLMPWLKLPRWAAGTARTGLSHAYARYCLASEGYRADFIERGC